MDERRFRTSEYNRVQRHRIGDIEFEMIHQTQPGDCVLINFLNTESLVRDNVVSMTPRELRDLVIEKRRMQGENADDILEDNSPLSYADTVRLFSTITNIQPKQEDIVTINGRIARQELRNQIENGILEYLDTYESGLCTTGMGYHSRTIWKLDTNMYIVIDPMNQNGFTQYDKNGLVDNLTNLCMNQEPNNNFFFFLRSKQDE